MSSGFAKEDLDSFFETEGVGIEARIVLSPSPLTVRIINVAFSADTLEVTLYNETDVVAALPSFLCKATDLAGVARGMQVTFPNLQSHEDGYQKIYEITPRIVSDGTQVSRVYLKEL